MSKYIYSFCFFYCCCVLLSCTAQSTSGKYIEAYNLHFLMGENASIEYPWMENAAFANCAINSEVEGFGRTLFAKKYLSIFPYGHLRTEFEQRILLPAHEEKEGLLTFESKGENIETISIFIDGINNKEKYVFSDTVRFVPENSISSISKKILLNEVDMLNIRIQADGVADKEAYIAFSKLDIMIGNKNIDEYPVRKLPKMSLPKDFYYISFQSNAENMCNKIDAMKNQRIIALGESVHGNNTIRRLAYKLIMENVENQNCKLIIWEIPMENSLVYNRYVLDNEYTLDSTECCQLDEQRLKFLHELKQYNSNKRKEDKVRLLGMDYNSIRNSAQNSAIDIFDFVTRLNRESKIPEIDQLSVLLMEQDWNSAINHLRKHKNAIQKILTTDEIECIIHILSLSQRIGNDRAQRFISRDSVMFINTSFLLDHFSSLHATKAVIYAHSVHVNPISTYPVVHCTPFGRYMKNKYSKDYSPLLLLTSNGSMTVYDQKFNRGKETLQSPPAESIESVLNQVDSDIFYFPVTSHFDNIVLSRFQGDRKSPREFYPYNLYQRYKGAFFIKGSTEFDDHGKRINVFEQAEQFLMINNQRLKTLKDIKKRIKAFSLSND